MKALISVTAKATQYLQKVSTRSPINSVLLSLKSGGCNGFSYKIEPASELGNMKTEKCRINDLDVHICHKSLMFLIGCEIDWLEDDMGSRFVFNNPLAKSQCGCKSSFSV